ncbi:hypothetical protein CIPAW_07G026700 [Carya illinoinensis]|uniref:t-SNARE coiled-coil homology domain-containing protein n=1 Tax=Carya illinoinensis TaxID=32201 RepID=A0A8T1PU65_CARIL|nr:hypothetical protein CIPAW_07G026700 [Carya illinoinensis]
METRNQTLIFRRYRDALKSVKLPSSSPPVYSSTSSTGGLVIEFVNTSLLNLNCSYAPLSTRDPGRTYWVDLPPAWVEVSEEIAANVQRVRTEMAELAKAHAKALMPSFGDGKEDQHLIESLSQEITGLIKRSEKKLQRLSAAGPSEDSNVRKNVQGQDGDDLEMNLNGSRSKIEDDNMDNMVMESVNELVQIMKDLSVLVIDQVGRCLFSGISPQLSHISGVFNLASLFKQGTIVDRIDYNIQNVATTVEEGLKQLQKAERTRKHGGVVRCATVLIIMCFIMLVALILKEIFL